MTETISAWNGKFIGPGPIAIDTSLSESGTGEQEVPWLIAQSPNTTGPVVFSLARLGDFLKAHADGLIISWDAVEIHERLVRDLRQRRDDASLATLQNLCAESRWVDLRVLDKLIRFALRAGKPGLREIEEIVGEPRKRRRAVRKAKGRRQDVDGHGSGQQSELATLLAVFARLHAEAATIEADAAPIAPPIFEVAEPPPAAAASIHAKTARMVKGILKKREKAGLQTAPATVDRSDQLTESKGPLEQTSAALSATAPLGCGSELRGMIALRRPSAGGRQLWIDREKLPKLLDATERQYRLASAVLRRQREHFECQEKPDEPASTVVGDFPEARDCFQWDGETVLRNMAGLPVTNAKMLDVWLRMAAKDLYDSQKQPAPIFRDADRQLSRNPEHWGVWAGCHAKLWAWRQLFRMAKVARIQRSQEYVLARYETLPTLHSMEANLEVYRRLHVRVFRPSERHVFLAGRVMDLTTRCLAAVCLRRGYVNVGRARLYQYVLHEDDPLDVASEDLYVAHKTEGVRDVAAAALASEEFMIWRKQGTEEYQRWRRRTNALLQTVPLGLPGPLLAVLLQNDYGINDLGEVEILRLRKFLIEHVAYELGPFLEDQTVDLVASRAGMTANEAIRCFVDPEHESADGAKLRNKIRWRGASVAFKNKGDQSASGFPADPTALPSRRELLEYRALTLGGRPTLRASQPVVRQQEVLLSADEVMMEVAFNIVSAGFKLVGVAGNEFLIEQSQRGADDALLKVAKLAHEATGRLLGDLAAPIAAELTEEW